ncbi:hypothetical protein [Adhaeribacter aerolatus]|nr:hypothetical protein [Adhaeribacter aerolatus]
MAAFSALAQRVDVQEWPKGRIVLTSGDTLLGPITYHRTEDIIRVTMPDGSIQAFAPVNVSSFTVTDERSRIWQTFKPYLWNRDNDYSDYKAPAFFELLSEGNYSLVKREILTTRSMNYGPMYAGYGRYYDPYGYGYGNGRQQTVVQDLFYLYTPKGNIKALRNPKRDLDDLFGDKGREMKDFIKRNNLEYDNARDLARIVSHFNSLQ